MEFKNGDKILRTIKETCEKHENSEKNFEILKEIYKHLSEYINEPSDQRPHSIKKIIDSNFGRE